MLEVFNGPTDLDILGPEALELLPPLVDGLLQRLGDGREQLLPLLDELHIELPAFEADLKLSVSH